MPPQLDAQGCHTLCTPLICATKARAPLRFVNEEGRYQMSAVLYIDLFVIHIAFYLLLCLQLTYDYKFDLEDDKKIPCLCGAVKCQKWMN